MRLSSSSSSFTGAGFNAQPEEGETKCLNSELWHACAGPLVSLPHIGSRVVYFPQGHSEQVAASTNKEVDSTIPSYPGLQPQLICQLHNVTMHADVETDEVYAQMTLQPLSLQEQKDLCLLPAELGSPSKQPTNYFCKTLTASDTSTHGGFSVPRRAAEKVFPPLDYSQTPPCQELIAKDLHGNEWKFRHIFRGQPKRHLLTTGWSVFVSAKRLSAGDSVIFIWNESNQLLLGIRRAQRPQTIMPSSVLSSDSMHIGLLAAAAHAAATDSRFTIFYNPRASPSEFVIPLAKYAKAVYHTRVSVGMRFRMLFETEESSVRRYMGTITGIGDLGPVRWPNSHWRSVKVGWDESTAGERQPRVSLWEIEPLMTFPMYPSPFSLRLKRPWPSALPSFPGLGNGDMSINSPLTWLHGGIGDQGFQTLNFQRFGSVSPLMQPRLDTSMLDVYQVMEAASFQDTGSLDPSKLSNQSLHIQPTVSASLIQNQMLHQSHSQPKLFFQDNNAVSQAQILQLNQHFNDEQEQMNKHMMLNGSQRGAAPLHNLLGMSENHATSYQSLVSSFRHEGALQVVKCDSPSSKRVALEPQLAEFGVVNPEDSKVVPPPFDLEGVMDPQNILFGVDTAAMVVNGVSGFRNSGNAYVSGEFGVESDYLQCSENVDPSNPGPGTFVKVEKSGSLGGSVDISKFRSYDELRSEVAGMFGLEGVLEERSGWQLVFVDRENDVLLLGDDPWQEFVNNVWYIKILSPLEVQHLGKQHLRDHPSTFFNAIPSPLLMP